MTHDADIIIPTHNHALLLPYSVRSCLAQSVPDIKVIVIGDGVGDDTRDIMAKLLHEDHRLQFFDLPKSGRTGELHRHPIVSSSTAKIVVYHSDDDLLAPDHVERALILLEKCDVVVPIGTHIRPDGQVECSPWSLGEESGTSMARAGTSLFSLSGLSHTTSAYRRLPFGWRDTPEGFFTDQYMILQFLAETWCTFGLIDCPTVAHLADSHRKEMTPKERLEEIKRIDQWMSSPHGWEELRSQAQDFLRRNAALHQYHLRLAYEHITQVEKELRESSQKVDQLRLRAKRAEERVRQLNATRAIRLRNSLVRFRLARVLLSRRQ